MKLTLDTFIELIPELQSQLQQAIQQELVKAAAQIVQTAEAKIGVYQAEWPHLDPSTQAAREEHGYAPDDPLLASGKLRNAYTSVVSHHKATIGNSDPVAEYQELGTATTPPRPVLLPSVYENMDQIKDAIGKAAVTALSNKVKQ